MWEENCAAESINGHCMYMCGRPWRGFVPASTDALRPQFRRESDAERLATGLQQKKLGNASPSSLTGMWLSKGLLVH